MYVIVKTRCFYGLPLIHNQNKKNSAHNILEIPTKKSSLRNLTRFHGGLFGLEILEIFQALQSALLKKETKNIFEKDASQLQIA